jgi:hypothetical protein
MKKLLLFLFINTLITKSTLADTRIADAYFANIGGRYSYEATFDKDNNIVNLIKVNDFKQLKSSNGCFDINVFDKNGKIYKYLSKKKIRVFCN